MKNTCYITTFTETRRAQNDWTQIGSWGEGALVVRFPGCTGRSQEQGMSKRGPGLMYRYVISLV